MYQTVVPSPVMVKIISGYQANGQYQTLQSQNQPLALSRTPPSLRQQSSHNHQTYFISPNTQQGHHLIQTEVYHPPVEVYQMMSVEMPHLRRHNFGPQVAMPFSMNQNYQRRHFNNYDYNSLTIPPPHLNFRQNGNTNGSIKKPNWNNKQKKNSQKNFINGNGGNGNGNIQREEIQHYQLFPVRQQIPSILSTITQPPLPPLPPPPPLLSAQSISSSTASSSSASSSSSKTDNYHSDSRTNSPSPTPSTNQHDIDFNKIMSSNFQSNIVNNNNNNNNYHYDNPVINLTLTQHHLSQYITNQQQYLQYQYHQQQQQQRHANYYNSFLQSDQQNYYNNNNNNNNNNRKRYDNNRKNNSTSSTISSAASTTTTLSNCQKSLTEILITPVNFTNRLIPPDKFLNRSHLMQIHDRPINLINNSQWDNLSIDIWNKFIKSQQSEKIYKDKILLWKALYLYFKQTNPKYKIYLVGSTVNGFGTDNSDVDLCLIVRDTEVIQRYDAMNHLNDLSKMLSTSSIIDKCDLIEAKIPILKFHDSYHHLDVDLNCNNAVGVRNTHMLYCYSQIDWRVRPLIIVIKLWAHINGINDARNMTLSSYSLTLMVIHFLQCGTEPAVLPCLHQKYPRKFNSMSDIKNIDIHEKFESSYKSLNNQSLGELLYQFFKYYIEFKFNKYVISVRTTRKLKIEECRYVNTPKNNQYQWNLICIEEPFDLTNTARAVYDPIKFEIIKNVFQQSYNKIGDLGNLDSIFQQQLNINEQ